jgi:hypothetical protein
MSGCGHRHGRIILRIVIAIIVVVVAFSIGVKLGELRGAYNGGYYGEYGRGYRMMGYPMMNGYYGAPTATSTPTK